MALWCVGHVVGAHINDGDPSPPPLRGEHGKAKQCSGIWDGGALHLVLAWKSLEPLCQPLVPTRRSELLNPPVLEAGEMMAIAVAKMVAKYGKEGEMNLSF